MPFLVTHITSVVKGALVVVFSLLLLFLQVETISETVQGEEYEFVQDRTTQQAVTAEARALANRVTASDISTPAFLIPDEPVIKSQKPSRPFYLFHRALLL